MIINNEFFNLITYTHLLYINYLKLNENGPRKYNIAILDTPFNIIIKSYYYFL
jgi:hypothetical protein